MAAIGPQVGLCHCPSCEEYTCRWCWAETPGACPTCGVLYLAAPGATAAMAAGTAAGATGRTTLWPRQDLRVPAAVGALAVAVVLLGLTLGGAFRSGAGPGGSLGGPLGLAEASGGASASPADGGASPVPGATPVASVSPGSSADSLSSGAPTPTPLSTPSPPATPAPTPRPTPTSPRTPAPACRTVPNLVQRTVGDARAAWAAAGFTGAFSPANGQTKMIVQSQSRSAGVCRAPSTSISVTYTRPPKP